MPGPFGKFDLPLSELSQIPVGGQFSFTDPDHIHSSDPYGEHYDAYLIEHTGPGINQFEIVDRMHVRPSDGAIFDPGK